MSAAQENHEQNIPSDENGTSKVLLPDYWSGKNISDEVASIAEENMKENGFVFVNETGLYYSRYENCYYNPYYKLYYFLDTRAYYYYDLETKGLQFYSFSSDVEESPCLRITIKSSGSEGVKIGKTFIVTSYGASLGREGENHDISLDDALISKSHCKFRSIEYEGTIFYEVEDTGSKNGTFVDNKRVSPGTPFRLYHDSKLTIGSTKALCHLHNMYELCAQCAEVSSEEQSMAYDKWQRHRQELSYLKKKFGNDSFIPANFPKGYVDRAKERRAAKGSSCDKEKTESTSVHIPIGPDNKGYILLKKMGWKEIGST